LILKVSTDLLKPPALSTWANAHHAVYKPRIKIDEQTNNHQHFSPTNPSLSQIQTPKSEAVSPPKPPRPRCPESQIHMIHHSTPSKIIKAPHLLKHLDSQRPEKTMLSYCT
jgi:hypothetical protein